MTRTGFTVLATLGLLLPACGSDVETDGDPGAGGGDGTGGSQGDGGSGQVTSQVSGGSGGEDCDSFDAECNCRECGGTCIQACNYDSAWDCYEPPAPAAGERSCGGFENCDASEACIQVTPMGDGCVDFFCTLLPSDCEAEPTCACVAEFTDEHDFGTECTDEGGLEVLFYGDASDPPWDRPACGVESCGVNESCWTCYTDGSSGEDSGFSVCAVEDPTAFGAQSCIAVWTAGE